MLRTPEEGKARVLVTSTVSEGLTRTTRLFGARQLVSTSGTVVADAVTIMALSGHPLSLHTADGDESLTLNDAAGRPLWSRNARGTVSRVQYAVVTDGGRPSCMTETAAGTAEGRVREWYGNAPLSGADAERWRAHNLAGAMTERHDNAGINRSLSVSITGQLLWSEQQLLKPEVEEPDWATLPEEDIENPLTVSGTYDATGAPLIQTNADGVNTVTAYDICGAVSEARLRYQKPGKPDVTEVIILKDILYRADGVELSQTAGSGITDTYEYDTRSQYLTRHTTQRPAAHPLGALLISDLHYMYDPAGNILTLEDKGTDPAWHHNAEATGLRTYAYDTLYRLTRATGRERTPVSRHRMQSPAQADLTAGSTWAPYTETYTYDDGDNLTGTAHTGGSGTRTVTLTVATSSDRAVTKDSGLTPETSFLAGGLQKQLSDGRRLSWHADNQLHQVSPVVRAGGEDDTEMYRYADGGTRTRKIRTTQTSGGTQTTVTTYAGGRETRLRILSAQSSPQKHIVITEGGGVRLVENRLTGEVHLRYGFSDHLNSSGGETDAEGRVTCREEYLPYGGSAGSDEDESEVSHLLQRTYRYSGKERNVTGLIHYGWRYYQPETGRWLSADPGGLIDGANLFRFCLNNPVNMADKDGLMPFPCINRGGNSRFHSFIVWTMAGTAVDVKNILMVIVQERLSKSRLTA